MDWTAVSAHRAQLGEGPFWDVAQQALYWVDIVGRQALRWRDGRLRTWRLPEPGSAFIPTERGDALVTLVSGVYRLDLDSPEHAPGLQLLCVADPFPGNRANEARCDVQGRLWLGSMQNNIGPQGEDLPVRRRSGGLFRVDADAHVTPLLQGLGIANTLLWSEDGSTLYLADSLEATLYRYPVAANGRLGSPQVHLAPHARGVPDGSAMDSQGFIWNARWDGSCLLRLNPEGEVQQIIELPVSRPTSCVFGGPDLCTLFVTSAASPEDHPLDGALLSMRVDIPGLPCTRFAG